MADDVLAEALARIEHKVDALVKHFGIITQPMHFPGQVCPACKSFIDYQIDVVKGVVVRKCKCATGKVPPMIPLTPITTGEKPNGSATASEDIAAIVGEALASNRGRGKAR